MFIDTISVQRLGLLSVDSIDILPFSLKSFSVYMMQTTNLTRKTNRSKAILSHPDLCANLTQFIRFQFVHPIKSS